MRLFFRSTHLLLPIYLTMRSKLTVFDNRLLRGPSVSIYIGPELTLFTISKRLLLYYSNEICSRFLTTDYQTNGKDFIYLPSLDLDAFAHLHRYMFSSKLEVLNHLLSRHSIRQHNVGNDVGDRIIETIKDTCLILCRIYNQVSFLGIGRRVHETVLAELRKATKSALEIGKNTPLTTASILEAHDGFLASKGDETYPLWQFILQEMSAAFSRTPRLVLEDFADCLLIEGFKEAVGSSMHARIMQTVFTREAPLKGKGKACCGAILVNQALNVVKGYDVGNEEMEEGNEKGLEERKCDAEDEEVVGHDMVLRGRKRDRDADSDDDLSYHSIMTDTVSSANPT